MNRSRRRRALAGGTLLLALAVARCAGAAEPSSAFETLLASLVQNGALTADQAEQVRAVAPAPAAPAAPAATAADVQPRQKLTTRLVIGGKLHPQWDWLSTDAGAGRDPATRHSFHFRRLELSVTGELGALWSGTMTADFTSSNPINEAYATYKGWAGHQLHLGMAKAPFLWEEEISDSLIKGVERSASHRAAVEYPGRGIGSKLAGVHLHGQRPSGAYYAVAVTNAGAKNSAGYAGSVSNDLAYWGRVGFARERDGRRVDAGVDFNVHPDLVPGGTLQAAAAHLQVTLPRAALLTEVVAVRFPAAGRDATLTGLMVEPSLRLSDQWEIVLRYANVDSDGTGLQPGVLIRQAPATGEFDRMESWYLGGNWYVSGQAVKLTFGYEHADATGRISGPNEANLVRGLRSRLQLLF